ncbi:diacylglycerol kinase family protein [Limisalsivibrio acetivorans]|uniref:diacylglycerol kinase family protein n=1 Tax=Limisalsivibrio acetivorans TaxID=1304888 RepID=UPI0003B3ABF7|nr:diacylglycerol kinase family protein [Limisalsivibrio acetivorans]
MKTVVVASSSDIGKKMPLFEQAVDILGKRLKNLDIGFVDSDKTTDNILSLSSDLVVVAGSDTLLNEVLNKLENTEAVIACLPFGKESRFCRENKMPEDPLDAVERLALNDFRTIHLGYIGDRYFVDEAVISSGVKEQTMEAWVGGERKLAERLLINLRPSHRDFSVLVKTYGENTSGIGKLLTGIGGKNTDEYRHATLMKILNGRRAVLDGNLVEMEQGSCFVRYVKSPFLFTM